MNPIRNRLKIVKSRLFQYGILPARPKILNIFTTDKCNFSCWYCSRNISDNSPDAGNRYDYKSEFQLHDLLLLLNKYRSIEFVSYVGIGEPLLCKDLVPMAKLSKERKKVNYLITNGSLLHKYRDQIGMFFNTVSISLHGLSREELQTIAKVKGKVFDQFIENVQYLINEEKKLNPLLEVRASVVILKKNLERVREAAAFCEENAIPVLDLQNFLPLGPESSQECIFNDEVKYINFINCLKKEYEGRVKINPPVYIKRNVNELNWTCKSFFNYLRVDGLGQVSGCGRIMSPSAQNGNFRIDEDVFNNSYFLDMRKRFRTHRDLPECCRYCPDAQ